MRAVHPKLQRNHIGLDGFIWAIGVVEDRWDPLTLGRCKVRYFGWHTEDKELMPTEKLPWSYPLTDLDNGRNVVGPKEGDWVVGFFRDGIIAQEPVMIGVVPGIPEIEADPAIGFNDPRTSVLAGHQVPREPISWPIQHDDGSGSELIEMGSHSNFPQNEDLFRYVDQKEATTNRFERNEFIDQTLVQAKKDNIEIGQLDIPVAIHPSSQVGTDHDSIGDPFSELETQYEAAYPYNHAYYSESGHLIERDDTPGKERLHWFHRAGTFKEIHPQGTVVEKIVDDEYHIVLKSRYKHIEAMDIETVDWNKKLFVNKDCKNYNYDITIGEGGDHNITIRQGLYNKYVMDGDENIRIKHNRYYLIEDNELGQIKKDKCVTIEKDYTVHVYGYTNIITHENCTITALKNLNLNAKNNLNITCGGDLTIECAGKMLTKVAGNRWDVTTGDWFRLTMGSVFDLCSNIFIRIAATIFDYSFGAASHTIWSEGPINAISPMNVFLNGIVPAIPEIDPPIEPGPPSPADALFQAMLQAIIQKVTSMIMQKTMDLSDFSTLSNSVLGGGGGADKAEPIELVLREMTASFLNKSITSPIVEMDAPADAMWSPVSMEGAATLFVPVQQAAKNKTQVPDCKMFDAKNKFIESGQYVKSVYGADLFKFSKPGLQYALDSGKNLLYVKYNGYQYTIPEPGKICKGNGKKPTKISNV